MKFTQDYMQDYYYYYKTIIYNFTIKVRKLR